MRIDEGLDTGAIYLQQATPIGPDETAPQLLARLAVVGAELLSETLTRLDELELRPQREGRATHAPLSAREDGLVRLELERKSRSNGACAVFNRGRTRTHNFAGNGLSSGALRYGAKRKKRSLLSERASVRS
jgi:methionyl-tRNA formyltransferase